MPAEPVSLAQLQNQRSGPSTQPQPRKKATAATGKKSTNSPISDSDGSDLEIQEADEPSPVPPTRPTDEMGAAKYDTMQAVWSPRNKPPEVDKVKNAMVTFKDVVKSVRDAWKESTQAMKMAENKGENDKATKIKEDVVLRRRVINAVVTTALEKGHPRIVEKYVHSHSHSLTRLADHCCGHRSQKKRIVSFHVIRLVLDSQSVSLIMALNKGCYLRRQSLRVCVLCPRQWRRRMESNRDSTSLLLWSRCGRYSPYSRGDVEDPACASNRMHIGRSILLTSGHTICTACRVYLAMLDPDY